MIKNKLYVYGDDSLEIPSHLHFGKEMLDRMVEYGEHPALIDADNDKIMTFAQLAQKTVDIALSLARIGVKKGDVVSICSEKRMEVMPTVMGAFCAGAAFAPVEITFGAVPLQHRVQIAKPKVMFMSADAYKLHKKSFDSVGCIEKYVIFANNNQDGGENQNGDGIEDGGIWFEEFLTETSKVEDFVPTAVDGWKDYTLILFSSGTTGLPKGVPSTHLGTLINTVSCTVESFKYSSILITREWYFPIGVSITISCLKKGTTCVFTRHDDEEMFLHAIEKYKVRILQAVPSLIIQLSKSTILEEHNVSTVESILTGSTPLMKDQVEAVKNRFPNLRNVYQIYGMGEAGSACNNLYAPLGPRDGSVGVPCHGFVVKVVDIDTRAALGANQRGEICLKSPTLTPGYIGINNSEHLDAEGFYKTGDVGYYDTDGYFYIVNRIKELIKYKDISIAPAEMEAILCSSRHVKEAGISSVDGSCAALVVVQPGTDVNTAELADYLHENAKFFRLEGGVHLVEKLPRGAGDKLDRRALLLLLQDIL